MIKRSDTAKEKKLRKFQSKIGVEIPKKKISRGIDLIPSQRVTRSKKTVHLDSPRVNHSAKNRESPSQSDQKIVEKRKYFTRSSTFSEKSTSTQSDSIKSSILETNSLNTRTEKKIVKRANFIKLENFDKNSLCLAKQKFSCPWPARVLKIEKNKVLVQFFGDKRIGYVHPSEIYDFVKSSQAIQLILSSKKKPRGFVTGVVEIELLYSIFNKI